MTPWGRVKALTQRTWERRRASCRCVRRGKCRLMKMRVLETERTSSLHVNITGYIQPQGDLEIKQHFPKTVWPRTGSKKKMTVNKPQLKPKSWFVREEMKKESRRSCGQLFMRHKVFLNESSLQKYVVEHNMLFNIICFWTEYVV